jgi:hypothetical protein
MAMQLTTVLNSGVSGNYWKISDIYIQRDIQQISITMSLYLSQSCRQQNMSPLTTSNYLINGSVCSSIVSSADIIQVLYDYLKLLPEFAGETDV